MNKCSLSRVGRSGSFLACLGGILLLGPVAQASPSEGTIHRLRLLVPAYFYPDAKGIAQWERLFAASPRVPVVAIVNPASGPGAKPDENYAALFAKAQKRSICMIGYVSSSYARRPIRDVKNDVDRWVRFYPGIQGIFVDEQASASKDVEYYAELYVYIRNEKGLKLVVTNPGTICARAFFPEPAFDAVCFYENCGNVAPGNFPDWRRNYPTRDVAALPYGVTNTEEMLKWIAWAVKENLGCIYVTDDKGSNPWDRLPGYWDKEVDAVCEMNLRLECFSHTAPNKSDAGDGK